MQKTISKTSEWQVVKLEHLILTEHEIEKHLRTVKGLLEAGYKNIALSIAPNEYPYSKCLSLLLRCHKLVFRHNGRFVVIQTNEEFLKTIIETNLNRVIRFVSSEKEIEGDD
jgi:anti-anti-sigma regulatory factor